MTTIESLPTPARRRHAGWKEGDPVTILPSESKSGCEETHRTCKHCGLIRVTVHYPHRHPEILWQYPDGERADGLTPMCGEIG